MFFSVCSFVGRITEKLLDRFPPNRRNETKTITKIAEFKILLAGSYLFFYDHIMTVFGRRPASARFTAACGGKEEEKKKQSRADWAVKSWFSTALQNYSKSGGSKEHVAMFSVYPGVCWHAAGTERSEKPQ